jgi:hypothetical protein
MLPVALVTAVGGVWEDDFPVSAGPAHMVEMEVSQDDVGDIGWTDAFGRQSVEQVAAMERVAMQVPDPRVDEHHPIADTHEEATERQLQHPVISEEAPMRSPIARVTSPPSGLGSQRAIGLGWHHAGDAIEHRPDLQISNAHAPACQPGQPGCSRRRADITEEVGLRRPSFPLIYVVKTPCYTGGDGMLTPMEVSPFPYQGPLEPGQVHGRDALIGDLVERVTARRVTAVLGPRRYGKTSLLRAVAARCSELSTIWVDLFEVASLADVAIRLDMALASTREPLVTVAGRLAAAVSLNLGVLKVELSRPPRSRPDPPATLSLLLEVVVQAALRSPTLLVLDEFSSLAGVAGAAGALRTALQHHYRDLGVVFAGSHPSMMRAMFTERAQPFFGQADLMETPPLETAALTAIIGDGFAATGRSVGVAARAVADFTAGHPQRAMQLADACWRATPPGESCDEVRFGTALSEVRAALDEPLDRILSGYQRGERAVLRALAHGGGLYGSEAELLDLSAGAAGHARQVLLDRGDLTLRQDRLAIVDPFMADWLRRRLPI